MLKITLKIQTNRPKSSNQMIRRSFTVSSPMAGAHLCATFPFLSPPFSRATTRPKLIVSASVSFSSTNPTRRKNYLRPKILKTLIRLDPQPEIPVQPVEAPATLSPDHRELELTEQGDVVLGEGTEVRVSETAAAAAAEYSGIVGKFSARTVLKYGVYFVGLFVLQTVVSVLLFGDSDPDESRKSNKSSGIGKSNVGYQSELGGVVNFDKSKLDEKIEEIRVMARKARKAEKKELKGGGGGSEEDAISKSKNKMGIEKEVGDRLVNLQKKLGSKREKVPGSLVNFLEMFANFKDEVRKNGETAKEGNEDLMFKKKLKFKTPTAEVNRNPKGFGGSERDGGATKKKRGSADVDANVGKANVGTDGIEVMDADDKEKFQENSEKGIGRLSGDKNIETQNGTINRNVRGRSFSEGVKSSKSTELGLENSQSLKKEMQETIVDDASSVNGSARHKEGGKQPLSSKTSGKHLNKDTYPWWLNLPYVLLIFMLRASDGQDGLYSIDLTSHPQNQNDSSYTVAFEDRVDANNFCFLLESCFEDQDDFRANAAPLPIKELLKAVKSGDIKVIVVKKGQLQLYAGQPLTEVEMALRSLVLQQ